MTIEEEALGGTGAGTVAVVDLVLAFVLGDSSVSTCCFCCCSSFNFAFCFRLERGGCASGAELVEATDVAFVEDEDEALREGWSEELERSAIGIDHSPCDATYFAVG